MVKLKHDQMKDDGTKDDRTKDDQMKDNRTKEDRTENDRMKCFKVLSGQRKHPQPTASWGKIGWHTENQLPGNLRNAVLTMDS